jgi:general secretion pathway protein H
MVPTAKRVGKGRMPISRAGISSKTGFTLLELVVVLFVVSLVAAIVLPSFASFGEGRLKSEAREIASVLRYVSDSAVSRKETLPMKFDLDKNVISWKEPAGEKTRRFADLTGVTTQSLGRVGNGEVIFLFGPLGVRENLTVHIGRGDRNMSVTLNHLSGRVSIKQDEKS